MHLILKVKHTTIFYTIEIISRLRDNSWEKQREKGEKRDKIFFQNS